MSVIFLSHELSESTPGFGGQSGFSREPAKRIARGDSSNSDTWTLSNHIGTHIDSPRHFSDAGAVIDSFKASDWIFKHVVVADIPAKDHELLTSNRLLSAAEKEIGSDTDLILIRTGFEARRSKEDYWKLGPGISEEMGAFLRERFPSVRAIGFDFLSLTSFGHREEGRAAHRAFLDPARAGHPVLIIEDMKLSKLTTPPKEVIIAPLRVASADGAPVTVFARL